MSLTQSLEKSSTIGVSEISTTSAYFFFIRANDSPAHHPRNTLPLLEELSKEHQMLEWVHK
jgi:hypothetical protein